MAISRPPNLVHIQEDPGLCNKTANSQIHPVICGVSVEYRGEQEDDYLWSIEENRRGEDAPLFTQ